MTSMTDRISEHDGSSIVRPETCLFLSRNFLPESHRIDPGVVGDYPLVMTNIANWKDPPCY